MAKRPSPGKCVYCLNHSSELTWDHVFPNAWFPDSTPANVTKWKVPACISCNSLHGKNEENLLVRLGLCINPDNDASRGIVPRVLRAFDSSQALYERDSRLRQAKKSKILSQALPGPHVPATAVFPGFGLADNRNLEDVTAVTISAKAIRKLTEKIVRGITYVEEQQLIMPPYNVHTFVAHEVSIQDVIDLIQRHGIQLNCGPGISVVRAVVPEDRISALYSIAIWAQLKLYAAVDTESADLDN